MRVRPLLALAALCAAALPAALRAQQGPVGYTAAASTARRSPEGRLEVGAVGARGSVRVDGVLDDEVWSAALPVGGFTQAEPLDGAPATEETEVRVAFDDEFLYVAARMRDSQPDRLTVNEIREDFNPDEQDTFELILDTFADRRNGYVFITNPEGARADRQVANEGREINTSWDAPWSVRTRRVADGWTAEMAIPFRALRFDPHGGGRWGINFARRIRRKNEVAFWSPVPRAYNLARVSLAGDLVGLPTTRPGRDLRVKPYAAGRTVRETGSPDGFAGSYDLGLDAKYGVTSGLTLDATLNPDFAQVEADEQQVNLSQFSQFFPEKREFFLENSGIFYVGDAARNNRVTLVPTADEDLLLFFSRRIGLTRDGREIPILGGLRLTGNAAGMSLGAMTVQTREGFGQPASNYSVFRARRNLFSGSDMGVIVMSRQAVGAEAAADDYNRVYGLDANLRFWGKLDWNSYLIRTESPNAPAADGLWGGEYAGRTSLNWEGNFFHGKGGVMQLGEGFHNELGYYRRTGVRKWFVDVGVRPRPARLRELGVREMHPHIVWNYYEDLGGSMVAKRLHTGYTFFLNNGGYAELSVNPEFQQIEQPFRIHPGVDPIPAGGYGWNEYQIRGSTDASRPLSVSLTGVAGGLWSGSQRTVNASLSARPSHRFRATVGMQRTAAELQRPEAEFVRTIWTSRANYSFNTNMFLDGLVQFDPERDLFNANVRLNLIHRPLSDLFIVFNEQRFFDPVEPTPPGRSVILKFTQMMAF